MRYIIFFLSFVLFAAGCSSNEDRVRDAIVAYTQSVSEVYFNGELNKVNPAILPKQVELLRQRVDNINQKQVRLRPALRSIRIDSVNLESEKIANVVVSESWDFTYVRLKTGKELGKMSFDLTMHYVVEKENEKWMVSKVDVGPLDAQGKKSFDPFVELPEDVIPAGTGLSNDELLKNSVLAYLQLLAEGYKNQDMTPLYHSATKKRAMKAFYHMSSMGEGQVKMIPELLEIEFVEVKLLNESSAQVISNEEWNYIYYSTQTGDKVYENNARYTLTYDLIKENDNRWLVDDITIDRIEEEEGKGDLPFFTRPHARPSGEDN